MVGSSVCFTSGLWLIWGVARDWIGLVNIMLACWRASRGIPACVTIRMIMAMPVLLISSKVMVLCMVSPSLLRLSIGVRVVVGVDIGIRGEVGRSVPVELRTRVGIPVVAVGPLRIHLTLDPNAVEHQVT